MSLLCDVEKIEATIVLIALVWTWLFISFDVFNVFPYFWRFKLLKESPVTNYYVICAVQESWNISSKHI